MKNNSCIYLFFILISTAFFPSCASKKKLTALNKEIEKLHAKVDSISNELVLKTLALSQAQKTISQLAGNKKPTTPRKKIDVDNHEKVSFFIQNIVKYVDWQPENYFILGVVGDDKLYDQLSVQFKGKKVADKPVVLKKMNSLKEVDFANMYYLSSKKLNLLSEVQKKGKNNVIIMSDVHQSTEGVHLNFYLENDALHFDLNDDELKKCQLVVSSSLKNLVK